MTSCLRCYNACTYMCMQVMAKDGEWIGSAAEVPKSNRGHLKDTMFPPTPEDATSLHLDRW